jgi:hypothetical protein
MFRQSNFYFEIRVGQGEQLSQVAIYRLVLRALLALHMRGVQLRRCPRHEAIGHISEPPPRAALVSRIAFQ